jgi:hypothetical protein
MRDCHPRALSVRRSRARKSSKSRLRLLRSEPLEPRMLLSGSSFWPWAAGNAPPAAGAAAAAVTAKTSGPTVLPITLNNNTPITGASAALSVVATDAAGTAKLTYTWSAKSVNGGSASFSLNGSNAASHTTITFTKAGGYTVSVKVVDPASLSASTSVTFAVSPTLSYFTVTRVGTGDVVGTTAQFSVSQCQDQFHNAWSGTPTLSWAAPSLPAPSAVPKFTSGGNTTTVTFAAAGCYVLTAQAPNPAGSKFTTSLTVDQIFTSVALSPATLSVLLGATQQFTPLSLDQFGQPMANQQTFNWGASAGTIAATGMFTAPASGGSCSVSVWVNMPNNTRLTGTAAVTLLPNPGVLQDASLAALVEKLDADGSLSRADMLQIFSAVEAKGALSATDFSDLKEILYLAGTLNIPGYVQVLAADVVNGNLANAAYQGKPLGNLAAGSSAAQLTDLVDKWFLGTDHPALCDPTLTYKSVAGALFPHTPSHADEYQGELGDCYFISSLGTLADSNPAAVENMIINNGDGTYTVRFYTGTYGTIYNAGDGSISAGFSNNLITADYVTVDGMLPVGPGGTLVYADYGASATNAKNALWIPLAEKAYAQWNQTGNEGRDDTNAYASIQGGWMATVDAQVLGYNATDYILGNTGEQTAIQALAAHEAVTIGTGTWSGGGTQNGLYQCHAYAIIGYNAAGDAFTLYNPWGCCQPGPLTWTQLQQSCTQMTVANTSGTVPIAGAQTGTAAHASQAGGGISHGTLLAPAVDALLGVDQWSRPSAEWR